MDLKTTLIIGGRKGLNTTWQLTKLIIPIYFAVTILKHTPFMPLIAKIFSPILALMGLPGEAALAIVMGVFINIYAGIAVILPLIPAAPLSVKQITILATVILICHNILVESAVSKKTGVSFWQMTLLRTASAFAAGVILNWVI